MTHFSARTFAIAVSLITSFVLAPAAKAGVLLKTGFESTETPPYVTGPLVPQNGWFVQTGNVTPIVQTNTVFAGTQALQINASGLTGQNIVRHLLTDPAPEKSVVYELHFQQSAAGTPSSWGVISVFGNAGFLGQILVDGTNASFGAASVPVSRGVWHDYQVVVNFGTATVSAFVDGTLIGSNSTGGSTQVVLLDLGVNGFPGTDTGFYDSISVINQAPSITKSFIPSTVALNGGSTLTIAITNSSATDPATNVGFSDTLPTGIALGSGAGFGGCGSPAAGASGNVISMTGATIPPSGTCTVQVFVVGVSPGAWLNTTSPVTSDQGTGNFATATLNVLGPPTLTKSFAKPVIYCLYTSFNTTTLTFTITNPAANPVPLTDIAFTDTLPAGLFVSSPNSLTGTCGGGTITAVPGSASIALSGASLAPSASCTFSVQVVTQGVGPMTNTATITASGGLVGLPAQATVYSSIAYRFWY
uniref:Conserved repeat domain n=1 Tax=Solibacter usitatus (strain Ellin6076) TaxID=234267 RepID=Q02BH6_SOLUE